jgi:hypothetical protein
MMPAPQSGRRSFLDQFRGLPWWQIVLAVLPLTLLAIGGLIGGLAGALGTIGNLAIARSGLSTGLKVALMIGVTVLCYIVVIIIATILYTATHPSA